MRKKKLNTKSYKKTKREREKIFEKTEETNDEQEFVAHNSIHLVTVSWQSWIFSVLSLLNTTNKEEKAKRKDKKSPKSTGKKNFFLFFSLVGLHKNKIVFFQ